MKAYIRNFNFLRWVPWSVTVVAVWRTVCRPRTSKRSVDLGNPDTLLTDVDKFKYLVDRMLARWGVLSQARGDLEAQGPGRAG